MDSNNNGAMIAQQMGTGLVASNQGGGMVHETAGQAAASQARALVEARYTVALARPRNMDTVRVALLHECRRPYFARVARYAKPITKTEKLYGPSIRFAETAIRCMGNIDVNAMTVYDDREKRIVRVTVSDLEGNTAYAKDVTIPKTIERRQRKEGQVLLRTRKNSYGDTVYVLEAEDDEIVDKEGALISKALRTMGLRLVPGDLIEEAMDLCIKTQANEDAKDPDKAKRDLYDAFAALGVTPDQIQGFLGHDRAQLTPGELSDLRAVYAGIRDGGDITELLGAKKEPAAGAASEGLADLAGKKAGAAGGSNEGAKEGDGKPPKATRQRGAAGKPSTDAAAGGEPPAPAAAAASPLAGGPPADDSFDNVE